LEPNFQRQETFFLLKLSRTIRQQGPISMDQVFLSPIPSQSPPTHEGIVENIIIYPDRSEFSHQFSFVRFYRQNTDAMLLRPLISMDLLLSYINCCIAHYSSVMFWIWFCLDLIKVIALAHPAIISTGLGIQAETMDYVCFDKIISPYFWRPEITSIAIGVKGLFCTCLETFKKLPKCRLIGPSYEKNLIWDRDLPGEG
jgi:hypothetical protein